jgi:hypothetical protein
MRAVCKFEAWLIGENKQNNSLSLKSYMWKITILQGQNFDCTTWRNVKRKSTSSKIGHIIFPFVTVVAGRCLLTLHHC